MERAIRNTYIDPLEEIVERLAPLAVAITEEKDAALRDQGLVVLGVLLARVPTQMDKFISPLIEAKKSKINAAKETVKLSKYDKSEKKAAAAAKAAAKKKPAPAAAAAKPKPKAAMAFDVGDEEMKDETQAANGDNVLVEVAPSKPKGPPPGLG